MTRNTLSSQVDRFFQLASLNPFRKSAAFTPEGTWVADDDEEEPETQRGGAGQAYVKLYEDTINLVRSLDPKTVKVNGLQDTIAGALVSADMFYRAMQIGNGFHLTIQHISNFINQDDVISSVDIDDEESPLTQLSFCFEEMVKMLRDKSKTTGKTGDSPEAIKELKELRRQVSEDGGGATYQELASFMPAGGYGGGLEQAPGQVFDPTGGMSMEEGKQKGSGVQIGRVHIPKDWVKFFRDEKEELEEQNKTEKNPKIKERRRELIEKDNQCELAAARSKKAYEQLSVAPSDQTQKDFDEAKEAESKARQGRSDLKQRLRSTVLNSKVAAVEEAYKTFADRGDSIEAIEENPRLLAKQFNREKYMIYQGLVIQKLIASQDKHKGEELRLRRALAAMLPTLSPTDIGLAKFNPLLSQIKEAEKLKIPIEQWWVEQGYDLGKIKYKQDQEGQFRGFTKDAPTAHLKNSFQAHWKAFQHHCASIPKADSKQVIDFWRDDLIADPMKKKKGQRIREAVSAKERELFGTQIDATTTAIKAAIERGEDPGKSPEVSAAKSALFDILTLYVKEFAHKQKRIDTRLEWVNDEYKDVFALKEQIIALANSGKIFTQVKGEKAGTYDIKTSMTDEERNILNILSERALELAKRKYHQPTPREQGILKERISTSALLEEIGQDMRLGARDAAKVSEDGEETVKPKADVPKLFLEETDDETGLITRREITPEEVSQIKEDEDHKIVRGMSNRFRRQAILRIKMGATV